MLAPSGHQVVVRVTMSVTTLPYGQYVIVTAQEVIVWVLVSVIVAVSVMSGEPVAMVLLANGREVVGMVGVITAWGEEEILMS